ncbi:ADP-ribosyl-(dinitrogen reductase) hydrolase [Burkholderia gladioli]|uniref:ADP-ribosyl-(dinitrogen reductase) hydrolase n=1 Tax=Burkholderia gladioli TaxID=28095 RepID=UPI0034DB66A2
MAGNLVISPEIREKLKSKHNVQPREIEQCFDNRVGTFLVDDREEHRTDPATLWFVAETNVGRVLKVIFVYEHGSVRIKSAYEASEPVIRLYEEKGR